VVYPTTVGAFAMDIVSVDSHCRSSGEIFVDVCLMARSGDTHLQIHGTKHLCVKQLGGGLLQPDLCQRRGYLKLLDSTVLQMQRVISHRCLDHTKGIPTYHSKEPF